MIQPNKNGKAYENEKNYSDGYDGHAPYSGHGARWFRTF